VGTHIRSGRRTNIVCPICRETGGSLQKKWASREPHVPKLETITNLSTAWDYAAKVLLKLGDNFLLFPPDKSLDEAIAGGIYDHFSEFTQHSEKEIKDFELAHFSTPAKSIEKRMAYFASGSKEPSEPFFADGTPKGKNSDPIHLKLPADVGTTGKASVSCLYGATVCYALRDLSILLQQPFSKDQNQGFAFGIYAFFTWFEGDTRHSLSFMDMVKTLADVKKYGRHGAATINAILTIYCLRCNKRGKGKNVQMERSEEGSRGWKCPQCGSTEPKKVHLSSKHLRGIEYKMLEKLTIINESLPLYFEKIVPMYKLTIQNGPDVKQDFLKCFKEYDVKQDFLKCFKEYEFQASKDLLSKRERWIITHYDPKQKSKRRQCRIPLNKIADIEINDERYFLCYKIAIAKFAEAFGKAKTERQFAILCEAVGDKLPRFFEASGKVLKDLGWPEAFITDKAICDIASAVATMYYG
jgi:hypothetical protein